MSEKTVVLLRKRYCSSTVLTFKITMWQSKREGFQWMWLEKSRESKSLGRGASHAIDGVVSSVILQITVINTQAAGSGQMSP